MLRDVVFEDPPISDRKIISKEQTFFKTAPILPKPIATKCKTLGGIRPAFGVEHQHRARYTPELVQVNRFSVLRFGIDPDRKG